MDSNNMSSTNTTVEPQVLEHSVVEPPTAENLIPLSELAETATLAFKQLDRYVYGMKQSTIPLNEIGRAKILVAIEDVEEFLKKNKCLQSKNREELIALQAEINKHMEELKQVTYPFENAHKGDYMYVYMSNGMRNLFITVAFVAFVAYKLRY